MSKGLLSGKTALITGSRRGIGHATVEAFAHEGCNVWACARTQDDNFEAWLKELSETCDVSIMPLYFDITDEKAMKEAVSAVRKSSFEIDILVNNAGVFPKPTSFQMTSMATLQEVFEVNYFSQLRLTQYVLRIMAKQKKGSVVNLSSIAGILGKCAKGQVGYGSSKAALSLTTVQLADEYGPFGVRVNAVAPGIIDTDMVDKAPDGPMIALAESSSLGRLARPDEVSSVIVFLASDMSSYVTGQVIRVDGGL